MIDHLLQRQRPIMQAPATDSRRAAGEAVGLIGNLEWQADSGIIRPRGNGLIES
jgi:hypothetical protein